MRFLFVDQILKRNHPRHIAGLKHITIDDPYLCNYKDGSSLCFMPSLIGETIGQLAAWQVMHEQEFKRRPVAGVVAQACIYKPAFVGDTLFIECEIDAVDEVAVEYHGQASVNGELVFKVDGAIGPMLPMQQFIDEAVVRQQFQEINRPIEDDLPAYINRFAEFSRPVVDKPSYRLQFDGLVSMLPGESCRAFKKITRAAIYLADHFPNKPVLPLTVLLECKSHLAQTFLQESAWKSNYQLVRMERIKMSEFVEPGDVIETELVVKKRKDSELVLHCRSYVGQKRVCVVDLVYQAEV
jgi:3-hydroxymyristoyl/3-hydroxydecanoyl-(acyl carrier protein) dehydratase